MLQQNKHLSRNGTYPNNLTDYESLNFLSLHIRMFRMKLASF